MERNLIHGAALTCRFDEIAATVLLNGWIIWDRALVGTLGACSVCVLTFLFPPMPLLPRSSHPALLVHFEADTERRKLGLPHRVNFLGRSSLDPEYTQTEEVELHKQQHHVCTSAAFQLNVSNADLLSSSTSEIYR